MAATPFRRALLLRIKERGGWSYVLERVASGETLTKIAPDLGCSRSFLNRMLTRKSQPKLHEAYLAARKEAGAALVEQAMDALDAAPMDRDALNAAKERANYRKWLAGCYDRETFGPPVQGPALVINAGQLHLAALQAAKPLPHLPSGPSRPALPPASVEVEVPANG